MTSYPFLSLVGIAIDEAVARRLPRQLATYHRALPIAEDSDGITVVMAHPGSEKVVSLLQTVLNAAIVPVRGDEVEIRAALDRLFPPDVTDGEARVLSYGADHLAGSIAGLLSGKLTSLEGGRASLEDVIIVANTGQYDLTVMSLTEVHSMVDVMRRLHTPLLIQRRQTAQPLEFRRVLCILRGHTPDEAMLDWIVRLVRAGGAMPTLLATASPDSGRSPGIAALLSPGQPSGEHIATCVRRIADVQIQGTLKLRQGDAIDQIVQEVLEGDYDLIAIAAEAYGDFIQRMIEALEEFAPMQRADIFVARPW